MNDEMLILLVEAHPELYNKMHPAYKLNSRKGTIWEHIGQQLDSSGDACMRRWGNLRDRYGRESRKSVAPSGSGAQPQKQWYLLDALAFLKEHIVSRPVRSSGNVCLEAHISSQPSQPPIRAPIQPPSATTVLPAPASSSSATVAMPIISIASPSASSSSATVAMPIISLASPSASSEQAENPSPSQLIAKRSRGSSVKKRDNTAVANSMCEAIELFKEKCLRVEEAGNPAVASFGKMITSLVSQMNPVKQTRAMQQMMEVAFQIQQEPE